MITITDIRDRKIFEGLEIVSENLRPVAAQWADGEIRSSDNLQLTLRSKNSKPVRAMYAYLTYYDAQGKELGYDFDFPKTGWKPGEDAKVSILLKPPATWAYASLDVQAEYGSKKCRACVLGLGLSLALVLALQYFLHG